jgi:hypothetical protein
VRPGGGNEIGRLEIRLEAGCETRRLAVRLGGWL